MRRVQVPHPKNKRGMENTECPGGVDHQIIVLRAKINTLKSKSLTKHSKPSKGHRNLTGNSTKKTSTNRVSCQEWIGHPPPKGKPKTKQLGRKTYNWCSRATGAPSTGGCNWRVIHKNSECNGFPNSNITARSKSTNTQPTKKRKVELIFKATKVLLKCSRISSSSDEHDALTLSGKPDSTVPEPIRIRQ